MVSSGQTLLGTSGAGQTAGSALPAGTYREITIINTGAVAGYFALDGGLNDGSWAYLPAGLGAGSAPPMKITGALLVTALVMKRIGGTDMSGVQFIGQPA